MLALPSVNGPALWRPWNWRTSCETMTKPYDTKKPTTATLSRVVKTCDAPMLMSRMTIETTAVKPSATAGSLRLAVSWVKKAPPGMARSRPIA